MQIKNMIGLLLLLSLAFNFFYEPFASFINRVISHFQKIHFILFHAKTVTKPINQTEKKLKKVAFSPKKDINSPGKSKTLYKFTCPNCGNYAYQEKIFDLNSNKAMGMFRLKADHVQVKLFKDFFVKCLLPTLVGAMLVSYLF